MTPSTSVEYSNLDVKSMPQKNNKVKFWPFKRAYEQRHFQANRSLAKYQLTLIKLHMKVLVFGQFDFLGDLIFSSIAPLRLVCGGELMSACKCGLWLTFELFGASGGFNPSCSEPSHKSNFVNKCVDWSHQSK